MNKEEEYFCKELKGADDETLIKAEGFITEGKTCLNSLFPSLPLPVDTWMNLVLVPLTERKEASGLYGKMYFKNQCSMDFPYLCCANDFKVEIRAEEEILSFGISDLIKLEETFEELSGAFEDFIRKITGKIKNKISDKNDQN